VENFHTFFNFKNFIGDRTTTINKIKIVKHKQDDRFI